MQGREALLGGGGHLGIVLDENASNLLLPFLGRDVQRSVEVLRHRVHLGSRLEEQHDDVHVAKTRGDVQRCLLLLWKLV